MSNGISLNLFYMSNYMSDIKEKVVSVLKNGKDLVVRNPAVVFGVLFALIVVLVWYKKQEKFENELGAQQPMPSPK
jgi:hypothetical protein